MSHASGKGHRTTIREIPRVTNSRIHSDAGSGIECGVKPCNSPLDSRLNTLEGTAKELFARLKDLEGHLSPVLRPNEPEKSETEFSAPAISESQTSGRMSDIEVLLTNCLNVIDKIRHRSDVSNVPKIPDGTLEQSTISAQLLKRCEL